MSDIEGVLRLGLVGESAEDSLNPYLFQRVILAGKCTHLQRILLHMHEKFGFLTMFWMLSLGMKVYFKNLFNLKMRPIKFSVLNEMLWSNIICQNQGYLSCQTFNLNYCCIICPIRPIHESGIGSFIPARLWHHVLLLLIIKWFWLYQY